MLVGTGTVMSVSGTTRSQGEKRGVLLVYRRRSSQGLLLLCALLMLRRIDGVYGIELQQHELHTYDGRGYLGTVACEPHLASYKGLQGPGSSQVLGQVVYLSEGMERETY